jgi:hypothetical protein
MHATNPALTPEEWISREVLAEDHEPITAYGDDAVVIGAPGACGIVDLPAPRLSPPSDENGQRWVRVQPVATLAVEDIALTYRQMLAAIDRHATEIGAEAWAAFVGRHVTRGQGFPIRFVENHLRAYVRRMAAIAPISSIDELPWDEEVFRYTLKETERPRFQRVEDEAA